MLAAIETAAAGAALAAHDGVGPWAGGGGFPFWIFPILWFVLIAGAIALFWFGRRRRERWAGRRAGEQALAERFANGDIDAEEYRARREVLRQE
ncbi:SHOCT domain-containing protein [Agrococcus baldri]|uniref:SHOCT domain-containing protein n=1 Tax=Agrococcus baldri TaxID=153730 RepID=A0AA87RJK2_9MICO|nr:SHOCT domain-containing protein [Agrococcus baldri]GEK81371.1 hypothetical protein ABA31_27220 [Agrococcus baldri]